MQQPSPLSLRQPLLEPRTFFLRAIVNTVAADRHIRTARDKAVWTVRGRCLVYLRAARALDAGDFRHNANSFNEARAAPTVLKF